MKLESQLQKPLESETNPKRRKVANIEKCLPFFAVKIPIREICAICGEKLFSSMRALPLAAAAKALLLPALAEFFWRYPFGVRVSPPDRIAQD